MSRFSPTPHGVAGQVLCLPDKEFRYLRHCCYVSHETARSFLFRLALRVAAEVGPSLRVYSTRSAYGL